MAAGRRGAGDRPRGQGALRTPLKNARRARRGGAGGGRGRSTPPGDRQPERGVARELTGARYAALGILDERSGASSSSFLTRRHRRRGRSRDRRRSPRGRGVLGLLIGEPRPLRLADVGAHPRVVRLPAGHPPMKTFLGVPLLIRGEAWGNLYLTEKAGGRVHGRRRGGAAVLADWAAIAIENARLFGASAQRAPSSSAPCAGSRRRPRSPARSAARPTSSACSS